MSHGSGHTHGSVAGFVAPSGAYRAPVSAHTSGVVMSDPYSAAGGRVQEWLPGRGRLRAGLTVAVAGPVGIAALLLPARGELDGAVFGLAMILPTAIGAAAGGPVAAVVAVVVGSATHNLLFTEPYLNFRVAATTDVVDLLVHTVVALAVSLVVVREQRARRLAAVRGEQAARVEALEELDRTRTALLGAVSHDLRTPLAAISAAASDLQAVDVEFSDQQRAVLAGTIVEQTARLDRTVENLLDAGRLQSSAIALTREAVEVEDLLAEALDGLLDPTAEPRVHIRVATGTPPTWVDPALVVAALRNVLDNALRLSPESTVVAVTAEPVDSGVRICIVDHGPGLRGQDPTTMFTPFHAGPGGGIGLGLAIARGFIEAHGGHIHVTDAPAGGAAFDIVLPAIEEPTP